MTRDNKPDDIDVVLAWRVDGPRKGRYFERHQFEKRFGLATIPTARETFILVHRLLTALPRDQYDEAIKMLALDGHLFETKPILKEEDAA